jgi:hypothetical protein
VTKGEDGVARVNQDSVYAVVEITNSSGEPNGNIETRVYDALGRQIVGRMSAYKVLRPGETKTWRYVVAEPEQLDRRSSELWEWADLDSSIRFSDSAGLVWWRTGTSTPEKDPGRVASKAYEEAQAERWRRMQARHVEEDKRRAKRRKEARAAKRAAKEQ